MSLDCIHSILAQTLMALLVIEEQIGSPWAIHLHVLQPGHSSIHALPFPHSPGTQEDVANQGNQPSSSPAYWHIPPLGLINPFPDVCQYFRQSLHRKSWGAIQRHVFPLFVWGIHLSRVLMPVRVHHRCTTAINSNL